MAEMDIVPYIGTRTPADFDTLFDELETARGTSASLSDAIGEKADAASTLAGYGITDAYTKTETDTALASKQDTLTAAQQAAANSGITAEKLAADEAALATKVTLDDIYGLGVTIPSNSDLDDYLSTGVYSILSASVAATISNLPITVGGRLEVKALNADKRYLQIYYGGDAVFQRRWNGTAWSPWYQYTLTTI